MYIYIYTASPPARPPPQACPVPVSSAAGYMLYVPVAREKPTAAGFT